jgi:HSP20 family molecular chaperone IbpA
MQSELIDVMNDQVRMIYRALTGTAIPEPAPPVGQAEVPLEQVTSRFVELETLARADPFVAELVPPFSFTPSLDATQSQDQIVVELAVPGVDRSDVNVEISNGMLIVSGLRRPHAGSDAQTFSHAEIPRGPFYRAFRVPLPVQPEPDVNLERGLLRIQMKRPPVLSGKEENQ